MSKIDFNKNEVEYDDKHKCQKCGGTNNIIVKDRCDNIICECETTCSVCGFEDFWATGFFESGVIPFEELKELQLKDDLTK